MRAIIIKEFGGLDSLVIENLPDPKPEKGQALIEVKAFGINHAETHMRKGEWEEAAKVSGIECVGIVRSCPGGEIPAGLPRSRGGYSGCGSATYRCGMDRGKN